jgi:hypothetical protein
MSDPVDELGEAFVAGMLIGLGSVLLTALILGTLAVVFGH